MMEAICSPVTSIRTRVTRRNIPVDDSLRAFYWGACSLPAKSLRASHNCHSCQATMTYN
jgi:hypothetical protein